VEVNLNHVKTTLKMEVLSGKTPEMVRKEIYTLHGSNLRVSKRGKILRENRIESSGV
jgi:hypothetical protein